MNKMILHLSPESVQAIYIKQIYQVLTHINLLKVIQMGKLQFKMGGCIETVLGFFQPQRTHRISGKKLREIKQLAEGGYGYVLLCIDVQTRKEYALKKLICQTEQQRESYRNQVSMMKQLAHCPHIIGFYGCHQFERDGYLQAYILMELAEKTVYDLILETDKRQKHLSEAEILRILKQTALGLKQMHDLGFIHQDVKVQNILISRSGVSKLCDFGSCVKEKVDLNKVPKAQIYKYEQRFQKNTTLMYRPPQMIDLYLRYPVDERVDVWMLGCVLYVLNYHRHPFQEEGKLSIVNASVRYTGNAGEKMEDFMRHMLTPNPHFRPRIEQIIEIITNWNNLQRIELNKIAQMIKNRQQQVKKGNYESAQNNQWRGMVNSL